MHYFFLLFMLNFLICLIISHNNDANFMFYFSYFRVVAEVGERVHLIILFCFENFVLTVVFMNSLVLS